MLNSTFKQKNDLFLMIGNYNFLKTDGISYEMLSIKVEISI